METDEFTTAANLYFLDFNQAEVLLGRVIVELNNVGTEFAHRLPSPSPAPSSSCTPFHVIQVSPHSHVKLSWSGEKKSDVSRRKSSCTIVDSDDPLTQQIQAEGWGLIWGSESELYFSLRPCPCFLSPNSALIGKVLKGMDIIQHISFTLLKSPHSAHAICVTKRGWIGRGEEWGLRTEDSILDPSPDVPFAALPAQYSETGILETYEGIKSAANWLFKQERYPMALSRFSKAIRFLGRVGEARCGHTELSGLLPSLIIPCILNSATCKLKMKDYDGALEDCNEAMELNPQDYKVYYRRGQAHHGKLNYEKSLYDLYRALNLNPKHKCKFPIVPF